MQAITPIQLLIPPLQNICYDKIEDDCWSEHYHFKSCDYLRDEGCLETWMSVLIYMEKLTKQ